MERVANEAALPRPHLYRFFHDKADLVAAVVAAEAAEVNERRRKAVARLPSFADQIELAITLVVELVHADEFWSSLVAPSTIPYTAYVAAHDPALVASNRGFWGPLLESGEKKGELRAGLDHGEVMNWLLGLEFLFVERKELFPTVDDVRHYVRTFVVPALVRSESFQS